jgi:hypothetical protein
MAKIWFATAEGVQKAYRLDRTRVASVGRDPGNDIVLRDARVSRQHAEIVFERGFFVLHDLSSANGSFVNGSRVKVAPLTDGAEVRVGNTIGHFSEELAPPDGPPPEGLDRTRGPELNGEAMATLPHEKGSPDAGPSTSEPDLHETRPHEIGNPGEGRGESGTPRRTASREKSSIGESPPDPKNAAGEKRLLLARYWTDPAPGDGELRVIRDEAEQPLFYFRRTMNLVGCFAALVAAAIGAAGTTALVVLLFQHRPLATAAVLLLTGGFAIFVTMLIPRRDFVLSSEPTLASPSLLLVQESRFSFPTLCYSLRLPDGRTLATLSRPSISRFGRHRWIIRIGGARVGTAIQSSLAIALVQNIVGSLFGLLRTPYEIQYLGRAAGSIAQPPDEQHHTMLDLTDDPVATLDRRIALALVVIVDAVEKQ